MAGRPHRGAVAASGGLWLLCHLVVRISCSTFQDPIQEEESLLRWAAGLSGGRGCTNSWGPNLPLCNWTGVACNNDEHVTALSLRNCSLSGHLPVALSGFSNLTTLDLSGNLMSAFLPADWSAIVTLSSMDLSDNLISGTLPVSYSNLRNLVNLDLYKNFLTGSIPNRWSGMRALQSMDLSENRLLGPIPDTFGVMSNLTNLKLHFNYLSGGLPSVWFNMTGLRYLNLESNRLDGQLPTQIGSAFPNISFLRLSYNAFEGRIPKSLGALSKLELLDISHNELTGTVPQELALIGPNLQMLYIARNRLTGSLPKELSALTGITDLKICDPIKGSGNCTTERGEICAEMTVVNGFCGGYVPFPIKGIPKNQVVDTTCVSSQPCNPVDAPSTPAPAFPTTRESLSDRPEVVIAVALVVIVFLLAVIMGVVCWRLWVNRAIRKTKIPTEVYSENLKQPRSYHRENSVRWENHFKGSKLDQLKLADLIQQERLQKLQKLPMLSDEQLLQILQVRPRGFPARSNSLPCSTVPPCLVTQFAFGSEPRQLINGMAGARQKAKFIRNRRRSICFPLSEFAALQASKNFDAEADPAAIDRSSSSGSTHADASSQAMSRHGSGRVQNNAKSQPSTLIDLNLSFEKDISPHLSVLLGSGSFGDVYLGVFKGHKVAVKLFNRSMGKLTDEQYESFLKELHLLARLQSSGHIVQMLGASLRPPNCCVVYEWMPMTLHHRLYDKMAPMLTYLEILRLSHDLAAGLNHLHPDIVHRDLKPDNILLDFDNRAKISDFGLSRLKATLYASAIIGGDNGGSPAYAAPEVFDGRAPVNERSDVYSLGMIFYEMMARRRPFHQYASAAQVIVAVSMRNERPIIPAGCPTLMARLIQDCWRPDPVKRPTCAEILRQLEFMLLHEMQTGSGSLAGSPVKNSASSASIQTLDNSTTSSTPKPPSRANGALALAEFSSNLSSMPSNLYGITYPRVPSRHDASILPEPMLSFDRLWGVSPSGSVSASGRLLQQTSATASATNGLRAEYAHLPTA